MTGTLYVVATPIGNLEDITARAARVLSEVSLIACEDTRHTRKLLDRLGIDKPLISCHDHNERERAGPLIERIRRGESIAVVSDAGTPTINDPGYRVIILAVEAGIPVVPLPGPNAAVTALSASGLPTDAFFFGGFLPEKRTHRVAALERLRAVEATLIFYETPHRVVDALVDIAELFPSRPVVLARELTKVHEEYLRGTASQLADGLRARDAIKGEFTLLIGYREDTVQDDRPVEEAVRDLESKGIPRMEAIKQVARDRGIGKREIYRMLEGRKS